MSQPAAVPYRPAVVSRFLAWVDRLPGHGWWVYPALGLIELAWAQAILWGRGGLPVGEWDQTVVSSVVYGPYALAALAYLNWVAKRSLAAFWPATGWPDAERADWEYRFTTSPARYGLLFLTLGIILGIGAFLAAPAYALGADGGGRVTQFVAYLPELLFGYTLLPVALYHTGRQLRLVARIHREATAIDPFDRVPVYAFSRLTVQAGLAYLIVSYFSLTVNASFQAGNVVSIAAISSALVLGVAAFVLPLWGIHDRLVHEKEALLQQVEVRMSRLGEELYRLVDTGAFDSTKVVSEALAGVTAMRERILRLPTWPWPPQVFRGFLSALALPVIVYLISRILSARIGA